MKKQIIFTLLLLSLVALSTAHYSNDYYWARDYYRTQDFDTISRNTYRYNTYHRGYDYSNYEDYRDSLISKYYYSRPYIRQNYNKKVNTIYLNNKRVYVKQSDYYLYYSPTFQREYLIKCNANPKKGSLFYIKCY